MNMRVEYSYDFLDIIHRNERKNDRLDFMKIKTLFTSKNTINGVESKPTE